MTVESNLKVERCRSCGAEIHWAHNPATGKAAPFNAEPDPDGLWYLTREAGRTIAYRDVTGRGPRYTSHFATCRDADTWRKTRPAPPKD